MCVIKGAGGTTGQDEGGGRLVWDSHVIKEGPGGDFGRYKGSSGMGPREQGSHARSVYPTQGTSRMITARAKKEADIRIIAR